MQVGRRLGSWQDTGGWVNPYITDGLVAMWDGEWNAGGGVHSDPVVPVNLVADGVQAELKMGALTYSQNAMVFDGNTYFTASMDLTKEHTTEIVWRLSQSYTGYHTYAIGNRPSGWAGRMFVVARSSTGQHSAQSPSSGELRGNAGTATIAKSISYHETYDECYAFYSGEKTAVKSIKSDIKDTDYINPLLVGSILNSKSYALMGEIFNVRVYNRSLTDDEVLANYAIDCERFGEV